MQERHKDRKRYWEEQAKTTYKYVIPFIEETATVDGKCRVLEIGCGEGGNIKPFLERGCEVIGIDLNNKQIENAKTYFSDHPNVGQLKLLYQDIYTASPSDIGHFDFIIMRDVIEHIHNQEKFMAFVKTFLKPSGKFFLGFPPWYMPFGGHQQICKNKLLSKVPWYHLLPNFLYKNILKIGGEAKVTIDDLLEIKETGISIERFDRIIKKEEYQVDRKVLYFINPNYDVKFNLTPRVLPSLLGKIPFVKNFVATCAYYIISYPKSEG